MKKVLKPLEPEEAIYYSDFSGKIFQDFIPVTLTIECGYGSEYDGAKAEFHLSDKGLGKLLEFLKENLCPETKEKLKREIDSNCKTSESHYNNKELYEKLI
jgi:hypothetical protein